MISSTIVNWVCYGIIGYIVIRFSFKLRKNVIDEQLPEFATVVGVIGTFVGIAIGLNGFNPSGIEESIPRLLEGMKTAFGTSIAGMIASFGMKILIKINRSKKEDINYDDGIEVTKELIKEIKNLNSGISANQENMVSIFEEMKKENRDGQEKLVDEMKSMNNDMNNKNDELISEFKSFASSMTEMNSKSIIEALNQVITDFNINLTEQFGENFKELNVAVRKLLEWQEEYKENIDITTEQLRNSVLNIGTIEKSIVNIADQSRIMIETHKHLNMTLQEVAVSQEKIQENNVSMINTTKEAERLLPALESYINGFNETIEEISSVAAKEIRNMNAEVTKVVSNLNEVIPDINQQIKNSSKVFNESLDSFKNEVHEAIGTNQESLKDQVASIEKLNKVINESIEETNREMVNQINQIVESTEKIFVEKVDKLNSTLEIELNNSLKILGGHMVQISNKFAEDYTPLAEKLKEVVNIARKVS